MTRTSRLCASGIVNHTPQYAEVDRHHIYPMFLCALLGVPDRTERVYLCSGCHDLAHHAIRHLTNEGTLGGHRLAAGMRAILADFWGWWQTELMATA